MRLPDAIYELVSSSSSDGLSPPTIRDRLKERHPEFYGTAAAERSVAAKNSKDFDHYLLQAVYTAVKNDDRYMLDRSQRPYLVTIASNEAIDEVLDSDIGEDLERTSGTVYVLGTGVFTREGKRIIKIGKTTQTVESRIRQLYTTGAMFRFEELSSYAVDYHDLLESLLHKALAPFRLNNAREFFTEDAMPFIEDVVALYRRIQSAPGAWQK